MGIGAPPTQAPATTFGIGSMTTPSAQGGLAGLSGLRDQMKAMNPVAGLGIGSMVQGASMGITPAAGAMTGYSPMGNGFASVYGGAPPGVQVAATGPGLFGAMARDFGGMGIAGGASQPTTSKSGGLFGGLFDGLSGFFGGDRSGASTGGTSSGGGIGSGASGGGGWDSGGAGGYHDFGDQDSGRVGPGGLW